MPKAVMIVDEMRNLVVQLEVSRDLPSLEELREQIRDWADSLDNRGYYCDTCSELQQDVNALEVELIDAVDDFAELEAWRESRANAPDAVGCKDKESAK